MTTRRKPTARPAAALALLLAALAPAACDGGDDHAAGGPDEEACEHMQRGPAQAVAAAADAASAPSATFPHTRVDVALPDRDGARRGTVAYEADEEADFLFFLSADVPFAVTDGQGVPLPVEASVRSGLPCAEVAVEHTVPLTVGTWYVTLGPTAATSVSLVVEEAGADHAHE